MLQNVNEVKIYIQDAYGSVDMHMLSSVRNKVYYRFDIVWIHQWGSH